MSFLTNYTERIYHTQPHASELAHDDKVLINTHVETYVQYCDKEVDTRSGTHTVSVPIEKTRQVTAYFVVSAEGYRRMLADFAE